jgi:hypothetical protein
MGACYGQWRDTIISPTDSMQRVIGALPRLIPRNEFY